jgi:hypothetical protein
MAIDLPYDTAPYAQPDSAVVVDSTGSGQSPLAGKFLLDGEWMLGPDNRFSPDESWEPGGYVQVGATRSFDENQVQFP